MNKKTKYWNGSIRLFSDLSWCFAIAILLSIYNKDGFSVAGLIGSALGMFFTFFFWSWNSGHLKNQIAKTGIHIIMGLVSFGLLSVLVLVFSNPTSFFSSFTGWYLFIMCTVWPFFIFRKYKRLMWPKSDASISAIKET